MLLSFPAASRMRLVLVLVLLSLGTLPALWGKGIGWRTDGSGAYPKAQPPLEWSSTKNVVWRTPMPGYGVSHPVLLGHRVFICSEPATLLCLHRDDGRILWQKTSTYAELEIEPEVREQLKVELVEMAELTKKQSAVQREMDLLNRSLTKDKAAKEDVAKQLQPFRTKIEKLKPSAVAHVPLGVGKVDEFRLSIKVRSAGPYVALLQSETISRNCELRGNADGYRKKTLRRESDVLPVKIAIVDGTIEWAAGVQREM